MAHDKFLSKWIWKTIQSKMDDILKFPWIWQFHFLVLLFFSNLKMLNSSKIGFLMESQLTAFLELPFSPDLSDLAYIVASF